MGKIRKAAKILAAVAVSASVFIGCTRNEYGQDEINANLEDINFARAASMSNFTEVTLGKLDTLKGTDSAGKVFGDTVIVNYTASDSLLKSLTTILGLTAPDSMDNNHQALKAQLMGLSGRSFDSAYIKNQVIDLQAAVDLFTAEQNKGQQHQIRLYATYMLPILQGDLDKATEIASQY